MSLVRSRVYIPQERWSRELADTLSQPDPAIGSQRADTSYMFALDLLKGTWRETVSDSLIEAAQAAAVPLWPDGAPGVAGVGWRHGPTLYPVLPDKRIANGSAVVVIPGGGYRVQAPWEAFPFGEWFSERGMAAFVLQYRLLPYVLPAALDDTQRAIRTVRANAEVFGIDPARVAVIGFSAGGHLSALASTLFDEPDPLMGDDVAGQSARPDAAILFYAAISPLTMRHLRVLCLGTLEPDDDDVRRYSAELQVSDGTPPTFIVGSETDQIVPVGQLADYARALTDHQVRHELHIYGSGVHGSGVFDPRPTHMTWQVLLENWLHAEGFTR